MSLTSLALAGGFFTTSATWEAVLPYVSVPHRPTKKKELLSTSPYTDAFQDIRVEKPLGFVNLQAGTSAPPGSLLETQIFRSHLRVTKSESTVQ